MRKINPSPAIRLWFVALLLVPALLLGVAPTARAAESASSASFTFHPSSAAQHDFVAGELLVGFSEEALQRNAPAIEGALAQLSVQSSETMQTCAAIPLAASATDAGGAERVSVRRVLVPPGRELAILAELEQMAGVAFASPNWIVRAAGGSHAAPPKVNVDAVDDAINDPFFANDQWYLQTILAEGAWSVAFGAESASPSLETIRVAIVDSGINFDHPEFSGRVLPGHNYIDPGKTAEDDFGHGSHVAGLMGALINNSTGMAGVARAIEIDPFKALDQNGEGSISDVVEAICDATDAGADIINLSLAAPHTPLLQAAVEYADAKGVLMVAATGNLGQNQVQWPADYPEVIAVAATTFNNTPASYSNRGSSVEIAAPGGDTITPMLSTWRQRREGEINSQLCPSYANQNDTPETYCYNLGTSMASALVSGAAALVWSVHPSLTADEVRLAVRNTATPLNAPATSVGQGLLNVEKAVRTVATSNLLVSEAPEDLLFVEGAAPYTGTIKLENPSLEPLEWVASVSPTSWLSFTTPLTGTVRYNQPGTIGIQITPTNLAPGSYGTPITLVGTRPDQTQVAQVVNLNFTVTKQGGAPQATLAVTGSGTAPVLQPGAAPYTETFVLENSSPAPLAWQALVPPFEWLTPTAALTGTVTLNASAAFSVTIDPSDLPAGRYGAAITVVGTREDGSQTVKTARIDFTVASGTGEPPALFSATGDETEFELPPASLPYTIPFALENTGTETITWQAVLPPLPWITSTHGLTDTHGLTGTLVADDSTQFSAEVDPSQLAEGVYEIAFTFVGRTEDSTVATQIVPVQLTIRTTEVHLHLPVIRRQIEP